MKRMCRVFPVMMLVVAWSLVSTGCGERSADCAVSECEPLDAAEGLEGESPDSSGEQVSPPGETEGTDGSDLDTDDEACELPSVTPIYDSETALEPEVLESTPDALITRLADRARDRHAREDIVNGIPFRKYDHYLPFYWEQRIANLEIIDRVAKGGGGITVNFMTLARCARSFPDTRTCFAQLNTGRARVRTFFLP